MSNLLPVGTRVKIVGPNCTNDNDWIGTFGTIRKTDTIEDEFPYDVYLDSLVEKHGKTLFSTRWFPATSIQEIKEQTMKIENEMQAKAARKFLTSVDELSFSLFEASEACEKLQPLGEDLQAALAAYESRDKVKEIAEGLSELERAVLVQSTYGGMAIHDAIQRLRGIGLAKKEMCDGFGCNAEKLGKEVAAYLRSQKRELKWEVRFAECNTFVCAVDYREKAENIAKAMNSSFCSRYTVREVK